MNWIGDCGFYVSFRSTIFYKNCERPKMGSLCKGNNAKERMIFAGPDSCFPGISDHQQSWGYEDGPWKGPGLPLLVAADFLNFF
jgi:hypothetical protein